MAIQDGSTLVINTGNYFLAPVGTAAPADLLAPGGAWENVGHTSLEDIFSLTSDGGEATVLGTLQSKSLRTSYSSRTETMRFTLQQFDSDSLRLFFGRNMKETNDERFLGVPQTPQPTQAAFLVVFIDGENTFSFYAPKVEILRGDDMELSDTESLAGLPLDVKPMIYTPAGGVANTWAWAVSPIDPAPAPTGATAGKPEAVVEKMVQGRIHKYYAETVLEEQAFVMDPSKTVKEVVAEHGGKLAGFAYYVLGEGIQKREDNLADEVAKMLA